MLANRNKLSDFQKPGLPEDAAKRSFLEYEEQRKLKLAMVGQLQKELKKVEHEAKNDMSYLDPNYVYSKGTQQQRQKTSIRKRTESNMDLRKTSNISRVSDTQSRPDTSMKVIPERQRNNRAFYREHGNRSMEDIGVRDIFLKEQGRHTHGHIFHSKLTWQCSQVILSIHFRIFIYLF